MLSQQHGSEVKKKEMNALIEAVAVTYAVLILLRQHV